MFYNKCNQDKRQTCMLYLINAQNYIFVIDVSAVVDTEKLKNGGCEFHPDLKSLYEKSAQLHNLTVEEIEGCEYTITHSELLGDVACLDQRNNGIAISKKEIETFITGFTL